LTKSKKEEVAKDLPEKSAETKNCHMTKMTGPGGTLTPTNGGRSFGSMNCPTSDYPMHPTAHLRNALTVVDAIPMAVTAGSEDSFQWHEYYRAFFMITEIMTEESVSFSGTCKAVL